MVTLLKMSIIRFETLVIGFLALFKLVSSSSSHDLLHQTYLDVKLVNTTRNLEVIRALNISTYRLSYERSKKPRTRIGVIDSDLAKLIPDAIDIVPKRILPSLESGGSPIVLHDVPVVNDQYLFMYGLGATQELTKILDDLKSTVSNQKNKAIDLYSETEKMQHFMTVSLLEEKETRLESELKKAQILRMELENEMQKSQDEVTFQQAKKDAEIAQIKLNEEYAMQRLRREDTIAYERTKSEMMLKLQSSDKIEAARKEATAALSIAQYERDVALQRAKEELKAKTAKKIAEAKVEAERANEDVHIRRLKAEAEEKRKQNIAAINAIATHIASSFQAAANNPRQTFTFIAYVGLLITGMYIAREGARLCRLLIESLIGKPKLIRETTRKSYPRQLMLMILPKFAYWAKSSQKRQQERSFHEKTFENVSLPADLKMRISSIAISASKAHQNDAPHRHILFYGPPGTGKTLVARKLAKAIGMDYAMMSGGDVGPLGPDAVTQIHNLFSWAKFSHKGVLLFVDEAEAFLANRNKSAMSENAHNALNALLFHTGTERKDFMMVLATNRPEDLDGAVLDRCDESLLFPLPDDKCRHDLLCYYFDFYVRGIERSNTNVRNSRMYKFKEFIGLQKSSFNVRIGHEVMNESQTEKAVKLTNGFSGREIAKLMIAIQGAIFATSDGELTAAAVQRIIETKVSEHRDKINMIYSAGSN